MDKDKLLIGYLDYVLSNAKLDDQIFLRNEYDRYSEQINVDDKLRENMFGLKNLLLTLDFVEEREPDMFFLTEKGVEVNLVGGYYKHIESKNKLSTYQKWALRFSIIAILSTICQFGYNTWIKPKSDTILSLEKRLDSLTSAHYSLSQKFDKSQTDFSNVTNDSLSLTKKEKLPNK